MFPEVPGATIMPDTLDSEIFARQGEISQTSHWWERSKYPGFLGEAQGRGNRAVAGRVFPMSSKLATLRFAAVYAQSHTEMAWESSDNTVGGFTGRIQ